jgi:hypothetical protein
MKTTKKFSYRVIQDNTTWTSEIIRRVTSKKNHISKSKQGFDSEAKATEWAELELKSFSKKLSEKNKRELK